MKRPAALSIICLIACGGDSGSGQQEVSDSAQTVEHESIPADLPLPPMPPFPPSRTGHLVGMAVSAGGRDTLEGAWRAQGALCEDPPLLQIAAETETAGTLLVFHFVPGAPRLRSYRVVLADSGFPEPPAAALGVQVTADRGVFAYQAVYGTAELAELNERAGGRFAATVREVDSQDSLRYIAVFAGVPVSTGPSQECEVIREGLDAVDTAGLRADP